MSEKVRRRQPKLTVLSRRSGCWNVVVGGCLVVSNVANLQIAQKVGYNVYYRYTHVYPKMVTCWHIVFRHWFDQVSPTIVEYYYCIYIGSPGIFSWLDFGGPKQPESQRSSFFSPGEWSRVALPERNRSASTHGGSWGRAPNGRWSSKWNSPKPYSIAWNLTFCLSS